MIYRLKGISIKRKVISKIKKCLLIKKNSNIFNKDYALQINLRNN